MTLHTKVVVPPGRYVVGDPCYAIPNNEWMAWLEAADYEIPRRDHVLVADVFGYRCVGVSTEFGDGVYRDQHGRSYGVDAGLLGLVPTRVAPVKLLKDPGTVIVDLTADTVCFYNDGVIHLGDLTIDTTDRPWEYADDDEDEDLR